ncbi:TonB-dependent siderophore receptor [Tistrella mobilis]|uniref:TonB-dependent siderophore receptor n=1 Tax=Tistrella mobilis TaxID=171437 RepID=UPI00355858A5
MTGVFSRRGSAGVIAAAAVLAPMGAVADETATTLPSLQVEGEASAVTTGDTYLAPVATSATKTGTPVLETPQSVSTVTRGQLDDQNARTVKDALTYTAGVLSTPDATGRYDSLFLRGFGGFGTSTRIVDFLDGLRLPRGQAFALPSIDPFLLDRIDVLKGPSAVLYGQTSPGGLVNQLTRSPSATASGEARIEGGSHGRLQGGIASQGRIDAEGQWQYGIAAMGRRADTRYDDVEEERLSIAPQLRWQPDVDTQLTLQGFYQADPKGGYFNSTYPQELAPDAWKGGLDRDDNVGDPAFDSYDRTQRAIGYSFDHRINDMVSVSSKTRYSEIDLDFQSLQMAGGITTDGLLPRMALRSTETVEGVATDNRAQVDFATGAVGHQTIIGVDYQHAASDWTYEMGAAEPLDLGNPRYGLPVGALAAVIDSRQTLEQTGVYLQDQMSLGGWRLLLGARYDWTEQESRNRLAGTTSDQSSRSPSYRAGLLYRFDNGIAPYVSYSTSFEPVIGVDASGRPFDPTEAEQWELGVKYEPEFMKALFTVSAFQIRQENVLTPGSTPGFNVQQGEVRSRGVEFEARGNVTTNLEVIAALTLLDTEVTRSTVAANIGKRPQAVPAYHGSVWASYAIDTGALDGLTLGAGVRVVGSSYADDTNSFKADGFALVDVALRYDLARLSPSLQGTQVTLNATNLFDETYYTSCTSGFYCQYGNGTEVLAGLRYSW